MFEGQTSNYIILLFALCCIVGAVLLYRFFLKWKKQYEDKITARKSGVYVPDSAVVRFACWEDDEFQSVQWKQSLFESGRVFQDAGIRNIILVHGTFVGDDPLDIFEILKPKLGKTLKKRLVQAGRLIMNDLGVFIPEYVEIAEACLEHDIKGHLFTWSSANHHFARLKGAYDLAKTIQTLNSDQKILMIGHSHAGQLFALISQMIEDAKRRKLLCEYLKQSGLNESHKSICSVFEDLKSYEFIFVTLGTPIRYNWKLSSRFKVLHLINHRKNEDPKTFYKGILKTEYGDYIQQWGSAGSDGLSPIPKIEKINNELDQYLGVGQNLRYWKNHFEFGRVVSAFGTTYLVDYKDSSESINCYATLLGHGVYTKKEPMAFQMDLIAKFLGS